MGFNCGIVGLPNVGKSTLFNALTNTAAAAAANYPFCTIEPNIGRVPVPDPRLQQIAAIAKSAQVIPTQLEIVDIAGLVRGASKGEGLGNQFLGAIREVDAIIQVLRCFEDDDITHVEGSVDPLRDAELIETELLLADIESLERRMTGVAKRAKGGDKEARLTLAVIEELLPPLQDGTPARAVELSEEHAAQLRQMQLLTSKPILYVANVEEASAADGNARSQAVHAFAARNGARAAVVSAAIEAELSGLEAADKSEYLASLGLDEPGLDRVIREGYALLDLITFFTAGPKETRAWTIRRGTRAPQAAGTIHGDFERGFIRAETIAFDDYVRAGGEQGAKDAGKMRQEGKDYIVQDGDILLFRFNV